MKYYISDLHIGHANIIALENRPFADLAEMEATIIANWNSVVRPGDDVYILGDFCWYPEDTVRIMPFLQGHKHLIVGNHDRITPEVRKLFKTISEYKEIKDHKKAVILSHYPIAHWKNADWGYIHLYGHIHIGRDSRPFEDYVRTMQGRGVPYKCYNVGAMMPYMDYTPRTLDEIRDGSDEYLKINTRSERKNEDDT